MFKTHSIRHSRFTNLTALTQYRSVTETDRQTDRQTSSDSDKDRLIIIVCKFRGSSSFN